jgi:hypothetical protein
MVYCVNLYLFVNFFHMKKALDPVIEQAGKTVQQLGETIGQQFVMNRLIERYSKPVIVCLLVFLSGFAYLAHRCFIFLEACLNYLEEVNIEKAIYDSPTTSLFVLACGILCFWVTVEVIARKR